MPDRHGQKSDQPGKSISNSVQSLHATRAQLSRQRRHTLAAKVVSWIDIRLKINPDDTADCGIMLSVLQHLSFRRSPYTLHTSFVPIAPWFDLLPQAKVLVAERRVACPAALCCSDDSRQFRTGVFFLELSRDERAHSASSLFSDSFCCVCGQCANSQQFR